MSLSIPKPTDKKTVQSNTNLTNFSGGMSKTVISAIGEIT